MSDQDRRTVSEHLKELELRLFNLSQTAPFHHPACRKRMYDAQSSPCTCLLEASREVGDLLTGIDAVAVPPVGDQPTAGVWPDAPLYLVVRERDTNPPEVYRFTDRTAALRFFDAAQAQWSQTYFCPVEFGEGKPNPQPPLPVPPVGDGRPLQHGVNCTKRPHTGTGYAHGEDDDRPFYMDGAKCCGRCHYVLSALPDAEQER